MQSSIDAASERRRGWFHSPAARRLLLVSLLCAAVPAIALAIFASYNMSHLRAEHSRADLANATQQYALKLSERLHLAQYGLDTSASELTPGVTLPAAHKAWLSDHFASVSLLDSAGQHWSLVGERLHRPQLDATALGWLADGRYYLHAYGEEGQQKRVLLLRSVDSTGGLLLVAELAPAYIWGSAESFAPGLDYCVMSAAGVALSCSRHTALASVNRTIPDTRHTRSAFFTWHANDGDHPAHYATVSLASSFGSGDWIVVARDRSAAGVITLNQFALAAAAIVLLSLAMVALLASGQIRRTLAPVAMLVADAAEMQAKGVGVRARVPPDDELAGVAHALNAMAARQQSQAAAIATLIELDQAVLTRANLDASMRMLLDRIPRTSSVDTASVTVFEPTQGVQSHTLLQDYHDGQPPTLRVDAVPRDAVASALAGRTSHWAPKRELLEMGLEVLLPQLARHFLLLPVTVDNGLIALLTLGYRDRQSLPADEVILPRKLADRLGVAAVSARQTQALIRQAHIDPLTQLFNRATLETRLKQALAEAKRSRQRLAVVLISLYRFAEINDTLGHAAGDEVLQEAARRLLACSRKTDTLARMGGNHLAVVLMDLVNNRQAVQFGMQVLGVLAKPFRVSGQERHLAASVGISVYPNHNTVASLLLRHANTALSRAEQAGGNQVVFYEEQMSHEATARATLEAELRTAVERGTFLLHYQPRVELASRRVTAAGATLCWQHPVGGLVWPEQFMPIAEETGLIAPIGAMALRIACKQLCAWDGATLGIARLALKISARQLGQAEFFSVVEEALCDARLAPERLELEVGEDVLTNNVRMHVDTLTKLARLGVRLAVDDFGGGRHALAKITQLPFHAVKLGKPLIGELHGGSAAAVVVRGLIDMAHGLDKEVIADAIDTEHQLAHLQAFGCDHVQGSFFSLPLASAEFDAFVAAFQSHPWARAA
jgi:diguanylate cyclase (GGDEF)-like protein